MRVRMPTALIATLTIGAAIVAACGMPPPSRSPSVGPTTAPVQAVPHPGLVELEGRMSEAATGLGSIVRALGEASAGSSQELQLVAGRLAGFAEVESEWIDGHEPDACYEVVASAYEEAVDTLAEAAIAFEALARAASPSDAEGQAAGMLLSEGSAGIEAARAAALEARAACRQGAGQPAGVSQTG